MSETEPRLPGAAAEPDDSASPPDGPEPMRLTRPSLRRVVQTVLGLALAAALVYWVLPAIGTTTWPEILAELEQVGWRRALWLFALLMTGLCVYTFLLTGSLPGLRNRKALVVNLGGTAVSSVLPAGGLMGVAATYLMYRSWGFARRDISTSVVVTGVWNFLARMALPVLGMLALLTNISDLPQALVNGAIIGVLVGLAMLGAFVSVLVSDRAARVIGRGLGRVLDPLLRRRGDTRGGVERTVLDVRNRLASVVRSGGLQMTLGLAGWFGCYFLLFWQCLHTMGVSMPFGHLFAAYAVGRLLTAVAVTPGSVGITEAGALTVLMAWGAPAAEATAGVVLFSIYTILLVVPLGAIAWLVWWLTPRNPVAPRVVAAGR